MAAPRGKARRGPRGRGTVFYHRGRGCYVGRVTVGGKRVERSAPTQAEVVRLLGLARPPAPDVTFAEWAGRFLAHFHGRAGTLRTYRQMLARVGPAIGPVRVADLRPHAVEALAARLLGEGLHPNTVRMTLNRVGAVQAALGQRRLRVAPELEHAETLAREMEAFRVKVTADRNETFASWRERDHDDILLALALAVWWGERLGPPGPGAGPRVLADAGAMLYASWAGHLPRRQ